MTTPDYALRQMQNGAMQHGKRLGGMTPYGFQDQFRSRYHCGVDPEAMGSSEEQGVFTMDIGMILLAHD